MPHEDHAAVVPGHAVAAVGDLADLRLELGADQRHALVAHSPRLTDPTPWPSKRSSTPSDDCSCQGTLATITPGVKYSRLFRRSALWLCNSCSYQRPRTYSGMYTMTTSRGLPRLTDLTYW